MKEQRLKIIISVMTISVISLIAMQIYWIENTIKIEEERFERTANTALKGVAQKIDKQETARNILKNITGEKNNRIMYFIQEDSTKSALRGSKTTIKPDNFIKIDSLKPMGIKLEYKYNPDKNKKHTQIEVFANDSTITQKNFLFKIDEPSHVDSYVIGRTKLVQNVVTDLIRIRVTKKLEERVTTDQLQKLLSEEFRNNGINTEFHFGVYKTEKDTFVLIKPETDYNELKNSNLKTLLFPDEIFTPPNELTVYFPNKKFYLLGSVSGMLALSIFLIFIVAGVFYKSVQMFIKQKKITDIKNDLINNITHEFKTPISTISVACEALIEPELNKNSSALDRYISIIKEENERLKMMVETLLNTAAFEKGTYHLVKEWIDLTEIIRRVTEMFEDILQQKNGKIIFDIATSDIKIFADKFHLVNIISNLIDNAIKYNERQPEITILLTKDTDSVKISISDNGIGIAKENFNKIFDTFYRVSTGNIHNVRGNGIGLSYVKKIIEAHGGNISVQSVIGQGSKFEIKLPIQSEFGQ